MTATLPSLLRRLLALGILAVPLFLICEALVLPLLEDYAALRQDVQDLSLRLAIEQRVAAALPARRAQLAALRAQDAAADGFLPQTDEALAGAALIDRIDKAAADAGGQVESTEVMPIRSRNGFRQLGIHVSLHTTLPVIRALFYDLESRAPMLFLDDVDLRTLESEGAVSRTSEATDMDASFDLYGYMRGGR